MSQTLLLPAQDRGPVPGPVGSSLRLCSRSDPRRSLCCAW